MFENCHPRRSSSNYPRPTKKMPKGDGGDGGVEVLFELVGRVCRWNAAAAAASDQLFKAPWREHRLGKRERERGRRKEGRKAECFCGRVDGGGSRILDEVRGTGE